MKLTGKARKLLQKYLLDHETIGCNVEYLESIHPSMQWGVIQDWADSLGYDMTVEGNVDDNLNFTKNYEWSILNKKNNSNYYDHNVCKTRQEARNAAIEKLNELINQNK